ncbi:Pentatricopeptide repeat-containing protein [Acorus calamus]|uniref:Pentatricopeptide repeat-containing protein n=1 Tax=Acorus calamus TaxID=4465 RepID=A0AAV9CDM2_ACOCL|nr:Pentatricopeptide repeat-containing protein [Acorus calamus]
MIDNLCKMGHVAGDDRERGLVPNEYTYNVLVDGYCKMGDMDEAKKMYEEMLGRGCNESVVSCNTMIGGLCSIERMLDRGINWDSLTYSIMIRGFCQDGRTREALDLSYNLLEAGLQRGMWAWQQRF